MADGDIRKHDRKHDRPDAERGEPLKKRDVRKGDERGAEELSDENLDQVSGGTGAQGGEGVIKSGLPDT